MSSSSSSSSSSLSSQPPGLNVIALISGGKDSLYTILHCIRNGHKVVALANLHPPLSTATDSASGKNHASPPLSTGTPGKTETEIEAPSGQDDIDSFMYQTIGWSVIPLYASALGIPLYRAPIHGGAVDTGRVYGNGASQSATAETEAGGRKEGEGEEDETESLLPLLRKVMAAHPEANAICAGAILSTYQRTRIESVAGRLGLTPLAWLWMYPFLPSPEERSLTGGGEAEAGLLEDMASVGCSARIIKVASGALDDGFLWGDVSGPGSGSGGLLRKKLVKGMKRFAVGDGEDIRGAVIGEGGEYETLAVDGPGFLWKGRIEIGEEGREVMNGEGGVAYLRLNGARVVYKTATGGCEDDGITAESVRRPALLDGVFATALDGLRGEFDEGSEERGTSMARGTWKLVEPVQSTNGGIWTVFNITAPEAGPGAADQMAAISNKIQRTLDTAVQDGGRTTADIVFTTVLLRSMTDFPLMNSIYVSLFKKPNPPARATVACGDTLPDGVKVMVSMVVDLGPRVRRDGLHVQSRSYWAPANIGPYSQAMSVPLEGTERVIYIAGQIPLEPASMELAESLSGGSPSWMENYRLRTVLSLQHMWRIGTVMEVGWWLGTVAFFTGNDYIKARARLAWTLWEKMHQPNTREPEEEEESTLDAWDIKYGRRGHEQNQTVTGPRLPDFDLVDIDDCVPAFFAVQVHELPKNSDIEWQGLGYRCEGMKMTRKETEFGRATEVTTNENLRYSCIELDGEAPGFDLKAQIQRLLEVYTGQPGTCHCVIYSSQPLAQDWFPGQVVPCKSVWGAEGKELAAGAIIQRQM
ncbi:hypothetical protein BJX99DRAFT_261216 [Aspergillus californicus]